MNRHPVKIESKPEFCQMVKKCLIRELYQKHKITQPQFEQLMQLQRNQ